MIIKVTTMQRFTLIQIAGAIKGDAATFRKANKLLNVLEMSDGEKELVNYRPVEGNPNAVQWDKPDHVWELEFKDPDPLTLLKETMRSRQWGAASDRHMLAVLDQLDL